MGLIPLKLFRRLAGNSIKGWSYGPTTVSIARDLVGYIAPIHLPWVSTCIVLL